MSPRFSANVVRSLVVNGLLLGVQLLSATLLARILGVAGRGEYAAILAWPSFLAGFFSLGLPSAVIYFSAREPGASRETAATAMVAGLVPLSMVIIAAWFAMPLILSAQQAPIIAAARLYMILFGLSTLLWNCSLCGLQGLGRFDAWNVGRLFQPILWIGLLVAASWIGRGDSRNLSLINAISYVIVAPLIFLSFHRLAAGRYRVEAPRARSMLRYGVPTNLATLPLQANQRLDQLLMASFLEPRVLGLYVVAVNLSTLLQHATSPIGQVLVSHIARLQDPRAQRNTLGQVSRISVLVSAVVGILLFATAPLAIRVLFGPKFENSIPAVLILVPAAAIYAVASILESALMGLGQPPALLRAESAGLVVTLAGLAWTLPRYPLIGASVTSLLSYVTILAVVLWHCHRITGIEIAEMLMPTRADIKKAVALALSRRSIVPEGT